jgi:hypothetical protein
MTSSTKQDMEGEEEHGDERDAEIPRLKKRVEELEAQLKESSKPPQAGAKDEPISLK